MVAPMPMSDAEITDVYIRDVSAEDGDKIIDIAWSTKGHGFGVLTILQHGGDTFIRTEHLSAEFAKRVLCKLVDVARLA